MADTDIKEGTIPNSPPLVVIHGGPGAGHEYLLPFAHLWQAFRIPVVFYDQIGCGSSTLLPQTAGDEILWQERHFIAELNNLLSSLHVRDGPGFHILGHSWGGRLAAAFAATRPQGLQRLIIASGIASTETWVEGMKMIRKQLPLNVQSTLDEEEQMGSFDSPRFKEAMTDFYRTYFCRAEPFPPKELLPAFKNMSENRTTSETIKGPSPLNCTGTFRNWTCIPRLHQIDVPTLVYNGEFDTSHDLTTAPFFEHIPRVRWITFSNAGHMCHLEGAELREKILRMVGEFLTQQQGE
ncbi:hypothetical protein MMC17_009116 [Xylographa soralifera]|nr:hypothetical protein [Xylographa soralifera]